MFISASENVEHGWPRGQHLIGARSSTPGQRFGMVLLMHPCIHSRRLSLHKLNAGRRGRSRLVRRPNGAAIQHGLWPRSDRCSGPQHGTLVFSLMLGPPFSLRPNFHSPLTSSTISTSISPGLPSRALARQCRPGGCARRRAPQDEQPRERRRRPALLMAQLSRDFRPAASMALRLQQRQSLARRGEVTAPNPRACQCTPTRP